MMIEIDGTENKAKLGANAMLGVSLAVAKAAAETTELPLYQYIGGVAARTLPVPMMNVINGGQHADNNVDIQEFMIMPAGRVDIYRGAAHGRRDISRAEGHSSRERPQHRRRRRGRLRAQLGANEEAIEVILQAIEKAGYRPASDISLALDVAASEFYKDGKYVFCRRGRRRTERRTSMVDLYADWVDKYPIVSIEDGCSEDDWDGWKLTERSVEIKDPARRRRHLRHQPRSA